MSRIGKKEIRVPKGVLVSYANGILTAKGPYGTLEQMHASNLQLALKDNAINIYRTEESKKTRALHGLTRALIKNMVLGVSQKFFKTLVAEGVGYKFQLEKTKLILNMGYSHPIEFGIPRGLEIKLESLTKITICGIDKQKVGLFASEIRKVRPPEPYKGKGIRYDNEVLVRKVGKTGK